MRGLGYQEVLVVAVIFLLLFGRTLIPRLAKNLGEGIRALRDSFGGGSDA